MRLSNGALLFAVSTTSLVCFTTHGGTATPEEIRANLQEKARFLRKACTGKDGSIEPVIARSKQDPALRINCQVEYASLLAELNGLIASLPKCGAKCSVAPSQGDCHESDSVPAEKLGSDLEQIKRKAAPPAECGLNADKKLCDVLAELKQAKLFKNAQAKLDFKPDETPKQRYLHQDESLEKYLASQRRLSLDAKLSACISPSDNATCEVAFPVPPPNSKLENLPKPGESITILRTSGAITKAEVLPPTSSTPSNSVRVRWYEGSNEQRKHVKADEIAPPPPPLADPLWRAEGIQRGDLVTLDKGRNGYILAFSGEYARVLLQSDTPNQTRSCWFPISSLRSPSGGNYQHLYKGLNELLESEKTYRASLQTFLYEKLDEPGHVCHDKTYLQCLGHLKVKCNDPELCALLEETQVERSQLSLLLKSVHTLSTDFLEKVTPIEISPQSFSKKEADKHVSKTSESVMQLLNSDQAAKDFIDYAKNFEKSQVAMEKITTNPYFKPIMEKYRDKVLHNATPLTFMIAPVQRPMRYPLLMKTVFEDAEKLELSKSRSGSIALKASQVLANKINVSKIDAEIVELKDEIKSTSKIHIQRRPALKKKLEGALKRKAETEEEIQKLSQEIQTLSQVK